MIISILNQKGGTGKTTLAVNLAHAYTYKKIKTLLVDSDSQGSALRWHERSGGDLIDLTCIPTSTLDKDISKFTYSYDRIIIDGVPRIAPVTISAINAADLILIPVQPSPYDIWATEDLVRSVKERIELTDGKTKAAFVVSRCIKNTIVGKEIIGHLKKLELPIFKNGTYQRVEYAQTAEKGLSVICNGKEAKTEIMSILYEIERFMHGAY